MENSQSPLQKYKRQPKLYIDLPSKGTWYNNNIVDKSEDLEVYSMTAGDEIMIKTPDALITGNASVNVIKSCIPGIKDPWMLTNNDFDYVMAAIRLATYGENINLSSKCSKCSNEDTYALPIQTLLDHISSASLNYELKLEEFLFRLRPITYKEMVHNQQMSMKVRRELSRVIANEDFTEDKKDEIMSEMYNTINTQTQDLICSIVVDVTTPEGDLEKNPTFIRDFLVNNDGVYFKAIQSLYTENNKKIEAAETTIVCSECQTESNIKPNLDYTSFFFKD
jgi:hypothetical protein